MFLVAGNCFEMLFQTLDQSDIPVIECTVVLYAKNTMTDDTGSHVVFEHMLKAFRLTIYSGAAPSHPLVGDKL